jgi:hypothetical protein
MSKINKMNKINKMTEFNSFDIMNNFSIMNNFNIMNNFSMMNDFGMMNNFGKFLNVRVLAVLFDDNNFHSILNKMILVIRRVLKIALSKKVRVSTNSLFARQTAITKKRCCFYNTLGLYSIKKNCWNLKRNLLVLEQKI